MRLKPVFLLLGVLVCALFLLNDVRTPFERLGGSPGDEAREDRYVPSDWWWGQRAFPAGAVDQQAYEEAVQQAAFERARAALETTTSAAAIWQQVGPYNIGGRVTAVVAVPGGTTVYLGAANGGVFKSVNSGVNWTPVFDQTGSECFSIGALALEPGNPAVIYAGTGEANSAVDTYDGNGLWRSPDGGGTWGYVGLKETARIARVAVDPQEPKRIFVAAMGTQFSTNPHRGLYRSEDGGVTWSQVLFVNDSTGACDVVINPAHPETLFCSTWERIRRPTYRRAYGPGCGIWRSVDHGTTWVRLANGLPAPGDNVGRIALALCATRPGVLYAQIISGSSGGYIGLGLYRSVDGGASWTRRDVSGFTGSFGGFGWYFGDLAVDPNNADRVYAQGQILIRSNDGGANFSQIGATIHVDMHGMWIDPTNSNRLYVGNDGGFFSSLNGGTNWAKSLDLPISQFYAASVDPSNVNRLIGGTQDNGCLLTDGSPTGWFEIEPGGDGFYTLIDPTNPDIAFSEWQNGSGGLGPWRSTSGGFGGGYGAGIVSSDRFNWCTPFCMDPRGHDVVLVGSQRVYKSVDNGLSYTPVSGDLTSYPNPPSLLTYHTLTTLAVSPASRNVYYAGTDDGRVWRSLNAGGTWTEISAGLPVFYVTRVTPDPVDPGVVYVCQSGFGRDEHTARVFRSGDNGNTWGSVAGNLPNAPANDLEVDPDDPNTLYAGTDVGVFITRDRGGYWYPFGVGMPLQVVTDLTLHQPSRTLVAATHGRSQWRISLAALPVAVGADAPPARIALSAPAPNPSRGPARFELSLPRAATVDVTVFDAAGRRVRTLLSGRAAAGSTRLAWDGRDPQGRPAGAGVYFVRALGAGGAATRRLLRVD